MLNWIESLNSDGDGGKYQTWSTRVGPFDLWVSRHQNVDMYTIILYYGDYDAIYEKSHTLVAAKNKLINTVDKIMRDCAIDLGYKDLMELV